MRPFWAIFKHCRHTLLSRSHVSFLVISQKISVRMEGIRSGMKFRTTISLQWLIEGNLEKELMAWFTRTRQRKLHKRRNIFLDIKYGTELNLLDLLDHHIRLKPQSQTMFQGIKISQWSKNTKNLNVKKTSTMKSVLTSMKCWFLAQKLKSLANSS